jgi:hypothetical protein
VQVPAVLGAWVASTRRTQPCTPARRLARCTRRSVVSAAAQAGLSASHSSARAWPRRWRMVRVTIATRQPRSATTVSARVNSSVRSDWILAEQHGQAHTDPHVTRPL